MTTDDSEAERSYPDIERLFTPWRLNYIEGNRTTSSCAFCDLREADANESSLVLYRASHCYLVMNLFPYSTGHLLIVPRDHVGSPEELGIEALHEMAELLPVALKAIRSVMNPGAFNIGYNLGADAGAGIAGHLHQHVVPRWRGDANFMPIVASTRVLPELLPVTWAKLRPEFSRASLEQVTVVATRKATGQVLVDRKSNGLPAFSPDQHLAIWRQALHLLSEAGTSASPRRWIETGSSFAMAFEADSQVQPSVSYEWIDPDFLPSELDRLLIDRAQG